ncbi:hypothetical protein GX586_14325, partial [bacterium]|nr:hypothetical protein [bacterium]
TIVEDSAECVSWRASFAWGASTFRMTTTVHAGSPRIDTVLEADWLERGRSPKRRASSASDIPDTAALEGSPTSTIECPMLRALFDFSRAPKSLVCDTPFAAVARKPGIEAPAQRWADVPLQGGGVALLNDSKYGHSLDRTTLRLGLLRSFINPDQLPDVGRHTIRWALLPHRGGWLEAGVAREGFAFNVPFETWQVREQEGVIGDAHSFLETGGDAGFIVTGVKRAEDGDGLIVRGYDASGRGSEASIAGHTAFTAAAETDILEEPHDAAGNAIACQNGVARIIARPSAIVTMRLKA